MLPLLQAAQEVVCLLPLVLGVWVAFVLLRFPDLTFQGSFALGGATFAAVAASGEPSTRLAVLAMGAAFVVGAAAGGATGAVNSKAGVPSLIAGVCVSLACYSVSLLVMGGPHSDVPVSRSLSQLVAVSASSLGHGDGVERLALVERSALLELCAQCAVVGGLAWCVVSGVPSRIGMFIRASGSNPDACRHHHISPDWWLGVGLALANGLAGISGALYAQHLRFADVTLGMNTLSLSLGAVVMSEGLAYRYSWRVRVLGLVVCVGIVVAVRVAILRSAVGSDYVQLAEGALLICAIVLSSKLKGRSPMKDLRL